MTTNDPIKADALQNMGVPASPSGCEAAPSAADASSQSRIPNAYKLRNRLRHVFGEALGADPVCCGRITTATIECLTEEAMSACEAVYRHVRQAREPCVTSGMTADITAHLLDAAEQLIEPYGGDTGGARVRGAKSLRWAAAIIKELYEALEAVEDEILLDGHLQELVSDALAKVKGEA